MTDPLQEGQTLRLWDEAMNRAHEARRGNQTDNEHVTALWVSKMLFTDGQDQLVGPEVIKGQDNVFTHAIPDLAKTRVASLLGRIQKVPVGREDFSLRATAEMVRISGLSTKIWDNAAEAGVVRRQGDGHHIEYEIPMNVAVHEFLPRAEYVVGKTMEQAQADISSRLPPPDHPAGRDHGGR